MRFTQQEKYEIVSLVDGSDLSANRTLTELGIYKRTFYNWYMMSRPRKTLHILLVILISLYILI